MTTYRRLCCNDLLRFGPLNLQYNTITFVMNFYMKSMALRPGICHVADTEGGQLAGYILGNIQGEGEEKTGTLSIISLRSMDMIDFGKQLTNLLEKCCDKMSFGNLKEATVHFMIFRPLLSFPSYGAYIMKFFVSHSNSDKYLADQLGYIEYEKHSEVIELMKPLPLLIKATEESILRRIGLI